ncbi:hypothetical protein [Salipiger mucosus]|uniref:hypothetical protein n=1 Tax=Salipiger mucosus TaxID=263378 RepID=UPI0005687C1B|nr:hypothetical protein [Salipiger mucosus]
MKTDESRDDTEPTWWMDSILGRQGEDPQHNLLRDTAINRIDIAHTELSAHLRSSLSGSMSENQLRQLSATLIAGAALHVHRENHPLGHSALMSSCVAQHPDLEKFREDIIDRLATTSAENADLRGWTRALGIVAAALSVLVGCVAWGCCYPDLGIRLAVPDVP